MKYIKYLWLIACSFGIPHTMKSILVSEISSQYSKSYSITFKDGTKIEVSCCIKGPMCGITRLSSGNTVVKDNAKFRNLSANEWFKQLKNMYEMQQQESREK